MSSNTKPFLVVLFGNDESVDPSPPYLTPELITTDNGNNNVIHPIIIVNTFDSCNCEVS